MSDFVAQLGRSTLTLISPPTGSYGFGKYWLILYGGIAINEI